MFTILALLNVLLALAVIIASLIKGPFDWMAISAFLGWLLLALYHEGK